MKNNMKKIIYIMTLGILFLASYGQANAAWNTYPSDCPNPLSIGNYTTGQGIQDGSNGCWTRKSVSADAGQTINVAVFYDNTNTTNADNVVIRINQSPAGSMTSKNSTYSFSGNLTSSSVGSLSLSQVTANLSSSETLTFSKSRLYKKGSTSGVTLPNGQTGYEAFNGGLSMGTIAKDDWGTILFSFSIGKTVTPEVCKDTTATNYGGALPCTYPQKVCTINTFTSNSTSINKGSTATLSWTTSNCNSVNLSTIGAVGEQGSYTVQPNSTTTYALNASGASGSASKTITISVNDTQPTQLCDIKDFGSNPTTINKGSSATLYWETKNCSSVKISGVSDVVNGRKTVNPQVTTTYTLTATGASGSSDSSSVKITVNQPAPQACSIDSFNSNYSTIDKGEVVKLSWNTTNCSSANISGTSVTVDGNKDYTPQATTTYTLTATGASGSSDSSSL